MSHTTGLRQGSPLPMADGQNPCISVHCQQTIPEFRDILIWLGSILSSPLTKQRSPPPFCSRAFSAVPSATTTSFRYI
jgi:hypothetical protein